MSILKDQKRFNDIIRGRIKQNFKKYVTHGEMIGKREKEFVKIYEQKGKDYFFKKIKKMIKYEKY